MANLLIKTALKLAKSNPEFALALKLELAKTSSGNWWVHPLGGLNKQHTGPFSSAKAAKEYVRNFDSSKFKKDNGIYQNADGFRYEGGWNSDNYAVNQNPPKPGASVSRPKTARETTPLLQMKYYDLGDFGGSMRSLNNWVLEVGGPTYRIKDALKAAGLRWNPNEKTWGLTATNYAAGQYGKPAQMYAKIRKMQEAAFKSLGPIIEAENKIIREENTAVEAPDKPTWKDPRAMVEFIRRNARVQATLERHGVDLKFTGLGRYSPAGAEPMAYISGDTFDIRQVLKHFGFRWESGKKAWSLPAMEWDVVSPRLVPALIQELIRLHGKLA